MNLVKTNVVIGLILLFCTSSIQAIIHENVTYSGVNVTWYAADNPHIVIGSVQISDDAGLTIEDGCMVLMDNGSYIQAYGRLTANGTAGSGITFTRRDPDDEWYGIYFYEAVISSLHYCTIEYATYYTAYGVYCNDSIPSIENCIIQNNDYGIYYTDSTSPTLSVSNTIQNNNNEGLYFYNCTDPSISNQIITGHSDPQGAIYMNYTGEFHIGAGNTINGNSWGLTMDVDSYPSVSSDGNIPTTGNTNEEGIQVYGGSTNDSVFWNDVSADYIITYAPTINASGVLIISDNVNVKFETGKYMQIHGELIVSGTASNGILFSRNDPDDQWYGLYFQSGSDGLLQYCTIEYATYYTSYAVNASESFPTLEHCTIRNNDYGIYVNGAVSPTLSVPNTIQDNNFEGLHFTDCTDPSISNQTITGHSDPQGAIYMDNTGEFHIGEGNTINGNTWGLTINIGSFPNVSSNGNIPTTGNTNDDGIQVYGGFTTESVTWYDVGADYIITQNPTVSAGGTLTIEDNVNVLFDNGKYLQNYGIVNANGTAGNGILFSRRDAEDAWYGLFYMTGSDGTLQYCTVEHATYSNAYGIHAENSFPVIEHCTIQGNDYGIYATGATSPTLSVANTIQNNNNEGLHFTDCTNPDISNQTITGHSDPQGAIYMLGTGEFHIGEGNSITGNSWGLTIDIGSYPDLSSNGNIPAAGNTNDDGIQVYGGSTTESVTWFDVGEDFIITQNPTINSGGSLTVVENVVVRFENGRYFNIYGTMNVNGTAGNEVLFTRRHIDDEWYSLYFMSDSNGDLNYATLEYATYSSTSYAVNANDPASLSLDNCLLQNNDYGFFGDNANVSLTNNYFQNNTDTHGEGIHFRNTINPVIGTGNVCSGNKIGIHLRDCSSPNFNVTTVDDNTDCGVYFEECSTLGFINDLTLYNNGTYGAFRFKDSGDFTINASTTIGGIGNENNYPLSIDCGSFPTAASSIPTTGNTNNAIRVTSGSSDKTGTWFNFSGLDHHINGTPEVNGELTIAAANTLKFYNSVSLYVNGTLNVSGSSGNRVLMTRFDESHAWSGLSFLYDSTGDLDYCTVEHATYSTGKGVSANTPTSLSFDHCILQNNDRGFSGTNASPDFISNNEIIDNNQYGIYLTGASEPTFGSELTEWNDIYGNGTYDLYNGTSDITASYIYWGTIVQAEIDANIYDENDNASLGLVTFIPYTNATHDEELGLSISAPENLTIWIDAGDVHLFWDAVAEATSYNIYTADDDDPYGTFSPIDSTAETEWSEPVGANEKKFYRVTAEN